MPTQVIYVMIKPVPVTKATVAIITTVPFENALLTYRSLSPYRETEAVFFFAEKQSIAGQCPQWSHRCYE